MQMSEPDLITVDGDRARPACSNDDILATTRRATSVENDPSTYLDGEEMGGSAGVCTPLPPGTDATGYYEASCNRGSQLTEETRTRSEEHTSELQSLMRISYAVFCLKKKRKYTETVPQYKPGNNRQHIIHQELTTQQ